MNDKETLFSYLIDIFTAHIDDGFGNVEEIEFIRKLRIQLEEAMKQANTLRERGMVGILLY